MSTVFPAVCPEHRFRTAVFHGAVRWIDSAWKDRLAGAGLTETGDWSVAAPGVQVSRSTVTNAFRVVLDSGEVVYFKRYIYPDKLGWRFFLRPSKAAREVFGFRCLKRLGIPTLTVIAFGEERRLGVLRSAFIVTVGVPGSVDLEKYARESWYGLPREERDRIYHRVRDHLFAQVRKAHAHRFFHQDLHWRNILLVENPDGFETVWIDCPRASIQRLRWRHGQLVDLSCLARMALWTLTRGQRYRALCTFLGESPGSDRVRRLYRQIEAHHRRSRHPPRPISLPRRQD